MEIRRATTEDVETLAGLNAVVQGVHVEACPDVFVPHDGAAVAAWFREVLAQPNARAWVAELDGEVVGYVLAFHEERPANPFARARRWCEVDQLAVSDAVREKGVARALVAAAIADAGESDLDRVELAAWAFNDRARKTAERLGFAPKMIRYERGVDAE